MQTAGLLIAAMITWFLATEIILRAYHREWRWTNFRYPQEHKFGGHHIYDSELGWIPNQQQGAAWGTSRTILQDGIRSNGPGPGSITSPILAVGDSFTFGDQVADWETWPAQLEQFSGRRTVNAGVDGYGVDQIFLRARHLMNQYQFSTVIFSLIPDDIRRCGLSATFATNKPYFRLRNGQLTLENVPVPATFLPERDRRLFILVAFEHSRLIHSVVKRLLPTWWLRAPPEKRVQDHETAVRVACALLHELEELTRLRACELIILIQHGETEADWEKTAVHNVLKCISHPTTRVLDLQSSLSKMKATAPLRHHQLFNPHLHMSAAGNVFVAQQLLTILNSN